MLKLATQVLLTLAVMLPLSGQAGDLDVKIGYAKCAHCTPISLTPGYAPDIKLEAIGFNTGNDVLTALVSKSIDVAQVTYLHYITALDRGFDVVAISGQISGGSQCLAANDLPLAPDDWAGLRKLIADYKAQGKPFRVAASRGNAQDIQMRGAFAKQGIDVTKELQFINIPNPSDHVQALRRGEVEILCTTDPFASQIRELKAAKIFVYPYDQASGKLTNLIVTRSDMIKEKPKAVAATVKAVVKVNALMADNKQLFIDTIQKVSGLDKPIAVSASQNLFPDSKMYRESAVAIAKMMLDLKYITRDVTAPVAANMDYQFLESAMGKPKTELGY